MVDARDAVERAKPLAVRAGRIAVADWAMDLDEGAGGDFDDGGLSARIVVDLASLDVWH
jgi:hypothetical protein